MNDIGEIIKSETEKRIKMMEDDNYVFPEKAKKRDFWLIIILIALCVTLILACMLGIIE